MRKYSVLLVAGVVLFTFSVMLPSCKHHETPVKPKLSFTETTKTVKESDGTINITMQLDNPAPEAIDVTYELGGTAIDKVSAGSGNAYDYEITSDYLECKIKKGETTGTIAVKLYSDLQIEDDEVIEISIKSVDSDNIEITRDDEIKITIKQEDGLLVLLEWGVGTGEHYADVDMDLFLWAQDNTSNLVLTSISSTTPSSTSPEYIFLPSAPLKDGNYGLSCNYYSGSVTPMNFVVSFSTLTDEVFGTPVKKLASYTLANINPWDTQNGTDPLLVETFTKSGTTWSNFSDITVPATGSRIRQSNKLDVQSLLNSTAKSGIVINKSLRVSPK